MEPVIRGDPDPLEAPVTADRGEALVEPFPAHLDRLRPPAPPSAVVRSA